MTETLSRKPIVQVALMVGIAIGCGVVGAQLSLSEMSGASVGGVKKELTGLGFWVFASLGFLFGALTSAFVSFAVNSIPPPGYLLAKIVVAGVAGIALTLVTWLFTFLIYGTLLFMDGPHFEYLFRDA